MRVDESSLNGDLIITYPDGTVVTITDLAEKRFLFTRSEVTRIPKDSVGFRKPFPYLSIVEKTVGPTGKWITPSAERKGNLSFSVFDTVASQHPDFAVGLRQQAEVKALLKLKDQEINLAQAFAERAQTASLFSSNLGRIVKAARSAKRGFIEGAAMLLGVKPKRHFPRRTNWRDPARNMGSWWLELQYGWLPLLSDIQGAVIHHSRQYPPEAFRVRVTGTAKYEDVAEDVQRVTGFAPIRWEIVTKHECRVRLFYTVGNAPLAAFSSAGLLNLPAVAWEVVPFSFIADWAIPIGDWLSSLDAAAGYSFFCGDRTEYTERISSPHQEIHGGSFTQGIDGLWERRKANRIVYDESPIPLPPGFKNPWSLGHAANTAALLSQTLKGTGRPTRVR